MNNLLNSTNMYMLRKYVASSFLSLNKHHKLPPSSQLHFSTNKIDNGNHQLNSEALTKTRCQLHRPALVHYWYLSKNIGRSIQGINLFTTDSTKNMAQKIATYDEVKELPKHPEKILIDVREPNELKETGVIPTSINIPLGTVEENLKLSSEEFGKKYGRKISKTTEVIFHCKLGGRAGKAADLATSLGYTNARNFKGSWTEWAAKEKL